MCTWVIVKPMSYGSVFYWSKIEKHKRFPWIMRWIMLLVWHLKENSMVSTSTTQFIWRLCSPYVYMSPSKTHVLRVIILLKEDWETEKIPLNYTLNYAPRVASNGNFYGKYLRYSVYLTSVFSICVRESLWSPCFMARHFLGGRSKNTKDSIELCVELCSRSGIWRKIPW